MPDGGTITIRTASTVAASVEPADATPPPGRHVRITVTDTGTGLDTEVVRRALESSFTTEGPRDGAGLRLATVYGAVAEAGGQVRLFSTPGDGATFDVYLPVAAAAGPAAPPDTAPDRARTILVVEDDAALRTVIVRILSTAGHRVLDAANPADALDRYGDAGTSHVDAVLTDYLMPGMTGDELIERLHRARPGLPALLISAYRPNLRPAEGPAVAFLAKPFTGAALLRRLQEILGS
jgi:CheY-like chemotaxis protein